MLKLNSHSSFFPHTNTRTSSGTSLLEPTSKMTSRTSLSLFLVLPRPRQSRFDTHYLILQFLDYLRRQLRLKRNTLSVPMNVLRPRLTSQNMKRKKEISFTELTGRFITRETIFVCCSQKVVLRGRTTAPLKICLRGQVFVHVETSRSHLAWPTDDRNLTDFFVI